MARRLLVTLIVAGLLGLLLVLLFYPFWTPRTHLFFLTAADDRGGTEHHVLHTAPLEYVAEELAALESLESVLSGPADQAGPLALGPLRSPAEMNTLGVRLADVAERGADRVILYVAAHGVSQDGRAWLVWNFDPSIAATGRVPLTDLLDQLKAHPASVKLLVLDAGRVESDPRRGMVVNEFPRLLEQELRRSPRDPALWVLCSHSVGERSHVSHALQRSVFGYFVERGLHGAADLNGDRAVDVDELARFVATGVSAWVQDVTGGRTTQTPLLLWGGDAELPGRSFPVLLPTTRDRRAWTVEQDATALLAARESSRTASFEGIQPTPPGTEASSAAPADQPIKNSNGNGVESSNSENHTGATGPSPEQTPTVPQLLVDAWKMRDRLASRHDGSGPADVAPHLWREFEERLLGYERLYRSVSRTDFQVRPTSKDGPGSQPDQDTQVRRTGAGGLGSPSYEGVADERQLAAALEKLVRSFRDLEAGRLVRRTDAGSLAGRIAALAPPPLTVERPASVGLLELTARRGGPALPTELDAAMQSLDRFAQDEAGGRGEFEAWIQELPPEYDRFVELRLCRQLAGLHEIEWPVLQLALRTRRLGEHVAAADLCCTPWVRPTVEQADRWRRAGERELLDRIGRDRQAQAVRFLNRAIEGYRKATDDCAFVQAAQQLRCDLLQRVPYYVRWQRGGLSDLGGPLPAPADLAELLDRLWQFTLLLEQPQADRLAELRKLHAALLAVRSQVEAGLQEDAIRSLTAPPVARGDAWQIELLLRTPLPDATARLRLLQAVMDVETRTAAQVRLPAVSRTLPPPRDLSPDDWQFFFRQAELEMKLARLRSLDAPDEPRSEATDDDALNREFERLVRAHETFEQNRGVDEHERALWSAHAAFAAALRNHYQTLPIRLEAVVRRNADVSDAARRPRQLAELRRADRTLRLLDARDAEQVGPVNPGPLLRQAEVYDLLVWHQQRLRQATADAPADEWAFLDEAAVAFRRQAATVPAQPPVPLSAPLRLEVQSRPSLSLVTQSERELGFTVRSDGTPRADVWIVLQYDPDLLEVRGPADLVVYDEHRLRAEGDAAAALLRFDPATMRPTLPLHSGRDERLRLHVRTKGDAAQATRLIIKAVSGDVIVRREVEVHLPQADLVDLLVGGIADSWTVAADGVVLHPFPNRGTGYRLSLVNRTGREQTVDVELVAPRSSRPVALPRTALSPDEAGNLLERFESLTPLASLSEIALPATDKPIPLPFPEPAGEAAAPPQSANGSQTLAPLKAPLPQGMLLIVTHRDTGYKTVRRIDVAPQHPRRYVRPRVRYNLDRQRIEISVTPHDRSLIPPDGVPVHCEIAEGISTGAAAQFGGTIQAPDYEARMFIAAPEDAERVVTLHLGVDGYPRAFVYRVPCGADSIDLPEETDRLGVRIVAPAEGEAYPAPVDAIPVAVQVDAPAGAFRNGEDFVEVGIDRDRDRELRGESPLRFGSDRQILAGLEQVGPDGAVRIETRIGDFHLDLPVRGLQNARVNVLGRISAGGQTAWSLPVEVVFDAAPPRASRVILRPAGTVAIGSELDVTVICSDDGMSGVDRVEMAIDLARTGQFADDVPAVPAHRDDSGRWVAKLDTGALKSGSYLLLVRAIDRVGNVSDVTTVAFQARTPEEVAATRAASTNSISGTVLYGKRPWPRIRVWLESDEEGAEVPPATTSNEQGGFQFPKVRPGKYTLKAEGVARNQKRLAEAELTVEPPPARIPPQRLELP